MSDQVILALIKWGVLLMWALWMSLVTAYNLADALKALGRLPATVRSSSNLALIRTTTASIRVPEAVIWLMFWGVIVWELIASVLLWWAVLGGGLGVATAALGLSLLLWAAFVLVNQLFMTWLTEPGVVTAHRDLFAITALSLLLLRLL